MLKQRDSLTYREAVRLRHLVPVSREHRERADGRVSGQVVRPREGKPSGIDSGLCILEAPILDSTHGGNLGMELGRQRSERDWHVEAEIERGGGRKRLLANEPELQQSRSRESWPLRGRVERLSPGPRSTV